MADMTQPGGVLLPLAYKRKTKSVHKDPVGLTEHSSEIVSGQSEIPII